MKANKMFYGEEGEKLYDRLESRLDDSVRIVREGSKTTEEAVDIFLGELHAEQDKARKDRESGKKVILIGAIIASVLILISMSTGKTGLLILGLMSCGMLLSATHTEHGEEKLNLLMLDDSIPAGAKLC